MKPADFRRLAAAGLTTEQIALVMEIVADTEATHVEKEEQRKADGRARWRKHQENKKNANVSLHEQTLANVPRAGVTRGEDKTSSQKIEPQEENKKESSARARLEGVLDTEHAQAVIDHRQKLRRALTPYAAKLMAEKLAALPDPNAAVDRMVENGWLTVYPDDRPAARSRASPRSAPPPSQAEIFRMIGEKTDGHDREAASSGRSPGALVPHLSILRAG